MSKRAEERGLERPRSKVLDADAHSTRGGRTMTKEEIARSAASMWCNCHQCDGIVNDTGSKCKKPNATCHKWYDGYRTANIALDKAGVKDDNKVLEKWWME